MRRAEGAADRGQQLRRGFFLAALDFGQVSERYARSGGDFAEGATLPETQPPQRVTEQVTKQDHRRTPFPKPSADPSTVPALTDGAGEGIAACSLT